jgi:23S rRNA (guanosine2251-2'-O)-methyltransferase
MKGSRRPGAPSRLSDHPEGEVLYGRHSVHEALEAGRRHITQVMVAKGAAPHGALSELLGLARAAGIAVERVERNRLDRLAPHHQGVIALADPYPYVQLTDILANASQSGEPPLVLVLDSLQDPQNLGTLLRSAEAAGVHGVVIPHRHSAAITPAVVGSSSGASEHLLIARHNLAQALRVLRGDGLWVVGLDISQQASPLDEVDLSGPIALVVGSEGAGLRRLVRQGCDLLVRLPMRGRIDSLNAAVAGSIVLYQVLRSRRAAAAA